VTANKSCPGIFVTGTDTGVGKTIVTAALARHFTAKGLKVGVMKPIETGVANTQALGAEASLLLSTINYTDTEEIIDPNSK
jgi:dethiobiotin synthetase